jgi:hypothetical protein
LSLYSKQASRKPPKWATAKFQVIYQRDVCALYFFYGLRLSDIAVQLQCNLNTIKSYLYRDGVPLLRTVLEDWGVQIEDLNFWTGHKESTLEQYESGVYDGGDRSGT